MDAIRRRSPIQRAISLLLALVLTGLVPGLDFYQALAQEVPGLNQAFEGDPTRIISQTDKPGGVTGGLKEGGGAAPNGDALKERPLSDARPSALEHGQTKKVSTLGSSGEARSEPEQTQSADSSPRELASESVPTGKVTAASYSGSAQKISAPVRSDALPEKISRQIRALLNAFSVPAVAPAASAPAEASALPELPRAKTAAPAAKTEGSDTGKAFLATFTQDFQSFLLNNVFKDNAQELYQRLAKEQRKAVLKQVLSIGSTRPGQETKSFDFHPNGQIYFARSPGLSGFLYSKRELERSFGREALLDNVTRGDYYNYIDSLLAMDPSFKDLRGRLKEIAASAGTPLQKDERLTQFVIGTIKDLNKELDALSPDSWIRDMKIYEILSRSYNQIKTDANGKAKTFLDSLDEPQLALIQKLDPGTNTIWLNDIFMIGLDGRWGTGGGSPYSLIDYIVKPELGGDAGLKAFVDRAHANGYKVVVDFIPNHVSLDSELVKLFPEALLHIVPPQNLSQAEMEQMAPTEPAGPRNSAYYFVETDRYPETDAAGNVQRVHKKILIHRPMLDDGSMYMDMLQINHFSWAGRFWLYLKTLKLYADFDIDGVRRDMAYMDTAAAEKAHWEFRLGEELKEALTPEMSAALAKGLSDFQKSTEDFQGEEFLRTMSLLIKLVKPAGVAFDEAYGCFTALEQDYSDAIYDKNDLSELRTDAGAPQSEVRQHGLYDAMRDGSLAGISEAIENILFRKFQKGGPAGVQFMGNHDEGNPEDQFGKYIRLAALVTMMFRPSIFYAGQERGVGQEAGLITDFSGKNETPMRGDFNKDTPFDRPVLIDWAAKNPELQAFIHRVAETYVRNSATATYGTDDLLIPVSQTPLKAWVESRVDPATGRQSPLIVAINWSAQRAGMTFRFAPLLPEFGGFSPRADRDYILRDQFNLDVDGKPTVYFRKGADLSKNGLYIELDSAQGHLFEVEEVPAGRFAAAADLKHAAASSILGPSKNSSAETISKAINGVRAWFSASWDTWTQRLTASSAGFFGVLQVPQILTNITNLAAHHGDKLSGLPWVGYSTGIIANMLLLSWFAGQKNKWAAFVQAVGVFESGIVVTQICMAGFMPHTAFALVIGVVTAGLTINALKTFGRLPERILNVPVWDNWNKLVTLLGFFGLPFGFAMTFGLAKDHMTATLAASTLFTGAGLALMIQDARGKLDKLPPALRWVWKQMGACLATFLFMIGPVSQMMNDRMHPAGMAGINPKTLTLAMAGNDAMLPRALYEGNDKEVKGEDASGSRLWFVGSFWGMFLGGWMVFRDMYAASMLSGPWFWGATVATSVYLLAMLKVTQKSFGYDSIWKPLKFLRGNKKGA